MPVVDCLASSYFIETTWHHRNVGTGFVQHYRLKRDGSSTYRDDTSARGTRRLNESVLTVIWNDGYSTEKYTVTANSCRNLKGFKVSRQWTGELDVLLTRTD